MKVGFGVVALVLAGSAGSATGCSQRKSTSALPSAAALASSAATAVSAESGPCPIHLSKGAFELCNVPTTDRPRCFHIDYAPVDNDKRGCVPGRLRVEILGPERNQTDELIVTSSYASGDASSALVELRLESMRGTMGFFQGVPGDLVGTVRTNAWRADKLDFGPGLLPSVRAARTAEWTDAY